MCTDRVPKAFYIHLIVKEKCSKSFMDIPIHEGLGSSTHLSNEPSIVEKNFFCLLCRINFFDFLIKEWVNASSKWERSKKPKWPLTVP